ncbi:MAG: hypothetical protein JXC85_00595 [Candidatus Aenigmarchaeota archaeon]|nr:hypothetical protein [Candidatus Aenigmarchaeota archaeon]
MEDELKASRTSLIMHMAAGALLGLVSPFMGRALYAIGLGLVAAFVLGHLMERALGKRKFSWWLGNGLFIYLFVWFDTWIVAVNSF